MWPHQRHHEHDHAGRRAPPRAAHRAMCAAAAARRSRHGRHQRCWPAAASTHPANPKPPLAAAVPLWPPLRSPRLGEELSRAPSPPKRRPQRGCAPQPTNPVGRIAAAARRRAGPAARGPDGRPRAATRPHSHRAARRTPPPPPRARGRSEGVTTRRARWPLPRGRRRYSRRPGTCAVLLRRASFLWPLPPPL